MASMLAGSRCRVTVAVFSFLTKKLVFLPPIFSNPYKRYKPNNRKTEAYRLHSPYPGFTREVVGKCFFAVSIFLQ